MAKKEGKDRNRVIAWHVAPGQQGTNDDECHGKRRESWDASP